MALINPHGPKIFSKPAQSPTHLQQRSRTTKPKRTSYRDVAGRLFWQSVAYFFLVVPDALMLFTIYYLCLWMRANDVMFRMKRQKFPLWYDPTRDLWYGPTAISHPRPPTVISSLHTAAALLAIPLAVFLFMQLRVRSFWDANHAIWGLLKAVALMTLLEETFKRFIARPRPYFMSACRPGGAGLGSGSPYAPIWATISACQGKVKPDAMQSFPSGHTGNSFAAATFLALYLNAKLKAFSDYHTNFAKQMAIVVPLIGAGLIAAGMVVDRNHHATDVLLSILLGVLCGLLAYRAQYRSLFNYHNNHIPQPYRERNSFTSCFGPKTSPPPPPETGFGTTAAAIAASNNHHRPEDGPTTRDKYLAVRWPFPATHKRGPVDTKKKKSQQQPHQIPLLLHHHDPTPMQNMTSTTSSGNRPARDVDGNSSVNAVWSMSMSRASNNAAAHRSSSAGHATTIHRASTGNNNAKGSSSSATNTATTATTGSGARLGTGTAEGASVRDRDRDREVVGEGMEVGSEVAEMV